MYSLCHWWCSEPRRKRLSAAPGSSSVQWDCARGRRGCRDWKDRRTQYYYGERFYYDYDYYSYYSYYYPALCALHCAYLCRVRPRLYRARDTCALLLRRTNPFKGLATIEVRAGLGI